MKSEEHISPPIRPAVVLLGLVRGDILRLPKALPAKYAPESPINVATTGMSTNRFPPSRARSSTIADMPAGTAKPQNKAAPKAVKPKSTPFS